MEQAKPIKPVHPPRSDQFPRRRQKKGQEQDRASTPAPERTPDKPQRQDPQFDPSHINEG